MSWLKAKTSCLTWSSVTGWSATELSRSTVRAPTSGYVMALIPNSVGAVVGSGEQLLEVVPDVEKLIVDVQMSPMDIDRIRVGQERK